MAALPGSAPDVFAPNAAELQVASGMPPVSYTHLRAHETVLDLVCRLLLEKKKQHTRHNSSQTSQSSYIT